MTRGPPLIKKESHLNWIKKASLNPPYHLNTDKPSLNVYQVTISFTFFNGLILTTFRVEKGDVHAECALNWYLSVTRYYFVYCRDNGAMANMMIFMQFLHERPPFLASRIGFNGHTQEVVWSRFYSKPSGGTKPWNSCSSSRAKWMQV